VFVDTLGERMSLCPLRSKKEKFQLETRTTQVFIDFDVCTASR
jgi:hypothetical protein